MFDDSIVDKTIDNIFDVGFDEDYLEKITYSITNLKKSYIQHPDLLMRTCTIMEEETNKLYSNFLDLVDNMINGLSEGVE